MTPPHGTDVSQGMEHSHTGSHGDDHDHGHSHSHTTATREREPMTAQVSAKLVQETISRCRALGLRRTTALEDLLKALLESPRPMTLGELAESKLLKNRCDRATVFRLLVRLEKQGILRRLGLHDRSAYYTVNLPDGHHDYLICTECGAIEQLDIACPVEQLEAQIARDSGFRKLYHELEFFGVCPKCS
ncbi:transcriptional repressor [Roseimicrobium sp. ORNL1]|uniref:Fur family transcriptional regulator n=1 Tax=Roseimicrobium sp. ORNL1 TaxID=2711231 RepID=UPI001F0F371D|nr:transcriptional repressor [Roseimicrobium sp. ORNL1]